MTRFYKVLNEDGSTPQGYGRYDLPTRREDGTWEPGPWQRKRARERPLGPDDLCTSAAFHLVRADQLIDWMGPVVCEAETDGDVIEGADKCGTRAFRLVRVVESWNERSLRHFAADRAESVLQNIEDAARRQKCADAIAVARRYADGEATEDELSAAESAAESAARSAAWAAAESAAESAAWAEVWAAWAAAESAAWAAAESAAWAAAWAAAESAAWAEVWAAAESAAWAEVWAEVWAAAREAIARIVEPVE